MHSVKLFRFVNLLLCISYMDWLHSIDSICPSHEWLLLPYIKNQWKCLLEFFERNKKKLSSINMDGYWMHICLLLLPVNDANSVTVKMLHDLVRAVTMRTWQWHTESPYARNDFTQISWIRVNFIEFRLRIYVR